VIGRLAGVAIDARFAVDAAAAGASDPVARARAARWIAANALATRGIGLSIDGAPPDEPGLVAMHAGSLTAVLAAIAALPVLVDTATLPCRWRIALRALGVPALDRPVAAAIAAGASVLAAGTAGGSELAVDRDWHGFRVRLSSPERMLSA
jgi:hypothetical protein